MSIASQLELLQNTKSAIKTAIQNKGVPVGDEDSFASYGDKIRQIGCVLKDLPTGAISTVNDAAELPLNALKVSVEAWQEGSGDPSPSNVRPIHGWDSGGVTVVGRNVLDLQLSEIKANNTSGTWNGNTYSYSGVNITIQTNADDIINGINIDTGSGTSTSAFSFYLKRNVSVYYKAAMRLSGCPTGGSDSTYDLRANTYRDVGSGATIPADTTITNIWIVVRSGQTLSNILFKPMIRFNSDTDTTYAPYNPNSRTYTHTFTDSQGNPLTVYGAEWDVVNGELGLKNEYGMADSPNIQWQGFVKGDYACADSFDLSPLSTAVGSVSAFHGAISNMLVENAAYWGNSKYVNNSTAKTCFAISVAGITVSVYDTDLSLDETSFRQKYANLQIKYPLATPTTIPQQPLTPRMLQGTNNLYADCGEVIEGEYFIGSSGGETTVNTIFFGKENQYNSDADNVPHAFDTHTEGTDFSTYLSTNDYATFTVLQDFIAIITVGVMEDLNNTGNNPPNCTFYLNNVGDYTNVGVNATSGTPGSKGFMHFVRSFKAGDAFFWSSINNYGYAVRLGQVDVIENIDISDYVQPDF